MQGEPTNPKIFGDETGNKTLFSLALSVSVGLASRITGITHIFIFGLSNFGKYYSESAIPLLLPLVIHVNQYWWN